MGYEMNIKLMIEEALKAREFAYVPYSNFKVGASVLMEDGSIYTGCNIENASFGATNCAERTAIFKAVSEGKKVILAICVVGSLENFTYPCGICRQVLLEFGTKDCKVIVAKNIDDYIVKSLGDIIPGAFTKEDLE